MPPAQIAAYQAFYQPGVTKVYAVTTMADYTNPTRAELNAGIDVTRQVRAMDGWSYSADLIDRPDMSTTYTPQVGGRTKSEASSLAIYCAKNGIDARQLLFFGYVGNIVFLDGGDVTTYKMDVWPVNVIAKPKQRGDSDPLTMLFQFSIPLPPAEDVAIP